MTAPEQIATKLIGPCHRGRRFSEDVCERHGNGDEPWPCDYMAEAVETIRAALEQAWDAGHTEDQPNPYANHGSPERRPIVQHVALTPTDDGGWAPRNMAQVETGRITITRTLLDDGDDVIDLQRDGDAEHAVTALGMLAMASDWVLHQPEDDDES